MTSMYIQYLRYLQQPIVSYSVIRLRTVISVLSIDDVIIRQEHPITAAMSSSVLYTPNLPRMTNTTNKTTYFHAVYSLLFFGIALLFCHVTKWVCFNAGYPLILARSMAKLQYCSNTPWYSLILTAISNMLDSTVSTTYESHEGAMSSTGPDHRLPQGAMLY